MFVYVHLYVFIHTYKCTYLKVPCGTVLSVDHWNMNKISQPTNQPIHSSTGNHYQTQNLTLVCTTQTESLTYMIRTNAKPESWTSFDYTFYFVCVFWCQEQGVYEGDIICTVQGVG